MKPLATALAKKSKHINYYCLFLRSENNRVKDNGNEITLGVVSLLYHISIPRIYTTETISILCRWYN